MLIVSRCCGLEISSKLDYIEKYILEELKKAYPNTKPSKIMFLNDRVNKINLVKVFEELGIERYCCRMGIRDGQIIFSI